MRYAQDATTATRKVRTVAELQMALEEKARGQHIARLRRAKRMTQQAMAEKLGIAYRTYQTWEAGTMPSWPNLERLAIELGVRPEDIIGDEPAVAIQAMVATDSTQLDRIEAMLVEVLERLDEHGITLPTPDEVAEDAGRRRGGKRSASETGQPGKRGTRRRA